MNVSNQSRVNTFILLIILEVEEIIKYCLSFIFFTCDQKEKKFLMQALFISKPRVVKSNEIKIKKNNKNNNPKFFIQISKLITLIC